MLPKEPPRRPATSFSEATITPTTRQRQEDFSIAAALAAPDLAFADSASRIRKWTSSQVIEWLQTCGMDDFVIDSFEINDISGDVLLDLQFEDLREQLNIQSFGKRHQLWSAICSLRGEDIAFSPQPTPFQDISRPCTTTGVRPTRSATQTPVGGDATPTVTPGGKKRRGRKAPKGNEIVLPAESVSIVAIEQLMPKPHNCNKGERCAKWRKQQRELKQLQDENGIGRFPISPTKGGRIYLAGDPGNATTAANIVPNVRKQAEESIRRANETDTMPSMAASSDVLGPGQLPEFALHENVLGQLGNRDPQDNVRQFLSLQHVHSTIDSPPSPPGELAEDESIPRSTSVPPMFPSHHHSAYPSLVPPRNFQTPGPRDNLKMLPKLEIPRTSSAGAQINTAISADPLTSACRTALTPSAAASAPAVYRLGTPQSEMDVPVTAVSIGPVARDNSQSVPPQMMYRQQSPVNRSVSARPSAAELRRPSMPLPALKEGEVLFSPADDTKSAVSSDRRSSNHSGTSSRATLGRQSSTPASASDASPNVKQFGYGPDCTHSGYMKKRKTKMLRHEWQEAHFRLKGSELSMHENARMSAAALEKIDVDNYGVTCSSNASSNKLTAAMKAFRIKNESANTAKTDPTAFNFQLIPNKEGDKKAAASGKTHHFAVKTKDERIDWMRELMLTKALKQKDQGYDVEINTF